MGGDGVEYKGLEPGKGVRSAVEGGLQEGGELNSHTPDPKGSVDLMIDHRSPFATLQNHNSLVTTRASRTNNQNTRIHENTEN